MDSFDKKTQVACEKLKNMLLLKQESLGLKTRGELANAINYYCDEGVEITEATLGWYLRTKKNGTSSFPSIEKLKAIGLFLGYELDEFYDFLFNEGETTEKNEKKDLTGQILEKVQRLNQSEKISLHRFLSEDLYRGLLMG
jgi:transcriptional regulator with XRE-family HTH domain